MMSEEQVDYFKVLEEKLAQRGWRLVGVLMAVCCLVLATTLYALVYKNIIAGLILGQGFSMIDAAMNVVSIIFLGQFFMLLRRVIRTKHNQKS